jgi:acetyl esterase/lipase
MSSRFPLLEGVPSMQALMEDPQYAQVRDEFGAHPDYQVPDVRVRSDAAPGPHGPVPVRVYDDGDGASASGTRPCLVWMHGGAFMAGSLDMPEADWTSRELARRAGAVVVSVDYRLCKDGVHFLSRTTTWWRRSAGPGTAHRTWAPTDRISVGGASAGTWRQARRCGSATPTGSRPRA